MLESSFQPTPINVRTVPLARLVHNESVVAWNNLELAKYVHWECSNQLMTILNALPATHASLEHSEWDAVANQKDSACHVHLDRIGCGTSVPALAKRAMRAL